MQIQRIAGSLFVGLLLAVGGCGDDKTDAADSGNSNGGTDSGDETGGAKDAGGSGGSKDAGSTAGGKDAGSTAGGKDAGTGGMKDAGPPMLSCTAYCDSITANCATTNEQYKSKDICLKVCASFPVGTAADMMGDTLGCRTYHAGAAKADAMLHCNHAGITGGDKDVSDTMGGPCGEGCEAFCAAAISLCTATNKVWDTAAACLTECKMFKASTTTFSTADTAGDDYHCRAYHLTAAAADPVTHCKHISKVSPPCK